jgi:hypothetical protein
MSRETEILERLGGHVADSLGEGPSEERRIIQRRDFLAVVASEKPSRRNLFVASAAVAAVVVAVLVAVYTPEEPKNSDIAFWIGEDGDLGVEGQWIRTPISTGMPIHFEGGSTLSLAPEASARMIQAKKNEVRIDLSSGKIHCNINKNNVTRWNVIAGPYTITVTGTIFNAAWEPKTNNLKVDVERGSVLVSGADLNEHGVRLAVGDHLLVDGDRALISLNGDTTGAESLFIESDTTGQEAIGGEEPESQSLDKVRLHEKRRSPTRASGRHRDAVRLDPDKMGLDALWKAASKARYDRDADTAESLLMTVKRRFPRTRQARAVNFLMGRVQLELRGNAAGSVKWFKRYLKETPRGPLAEEASGRIIDAYKRSGQKGRAKQYAEIYLGKYKDGLFDDLAKSVVNN